MLINADDVGQWESDVRESVELFNTWFVTAAPQAYREARIIAIKSVDSVMVATQQMRGLTPAVLSANPSIISALRMMTIPPLARDRLAGLTGISSTVFKTMEGGSLPPRMSASERERVLSVVSETILRMIDIDLMSWVGTDEQPSEGEVNMASVVVADRLTGAVADPVIRNAQERRQTELIQAYLQQLSYVKETHAAHLALDQMPRGTYAFHQNVLVRDPRGKDVRIPVDVAIQPHRGHSSGLPILIECKSAGDFTNTNKRRKEEAQKMTQLRNRFGEGVPFMLFLCGYFGQDYLAYEAAEGIDWVWEHRMSDMEKLNLEP